MKSLPFFLLILSCFSLNAQNIVQNGGFESFQTAPVEVSFCNDGSGNLADWYRVQGTPDLIGDGQVLFETLDIQWGTGFYLVEEYWNYESPSALSAGYAGGMIASGNATNNYKEVYSQEIFAENGSYLLEFFSHIAVDAQGQGATLDFWDINFCFENDATYSGS